MNKSELIDLVAFQAGFTKKDAELLLNTCLKTIAQQLASGEKVQLSGFGTFDLKVREPRVGRNPHTKEPIEIPATVIPVFTPSKQLREKVANDAAWLLTEEE